MVFEANEATYRHFRQVRSPAFVQGNVYLYTDGRQPYTLYFRREGSCFVRQLNKHESIVICYLTELSPPDF